MDSRNRVINADHEFSAPKMFNSPSNIASRTTEIEILCYLNEAEKSQKLQEAPSKSIGFIDNFKNLNMESGKQSERYKSEAQKVRMTSQINKKMPKKIRNSKELEKEQPMKASKFKARPLNKKILESKGELGLQCNKKRQVTIPQEFHFAIDERIPPRTTTNAVELFDKIALCLKSHSHNKKLIPRNTIPRPFQFQTEKRWAQKEGKFVVHKQIEQGRVRIPNPVPKGIKRIIV